MTLFVDLRASGRGGIVADAAAAWIDGILPLSPQAFAAQLAGKDVLFATHGFNVDRAAGIAALSLWSQRCSLSSSGLFVGVLWPGDSSWLPFIDYVYEGSEANSSGRLLAAYLNDNAGQADSLSFFSHSLGARMILETVRGLKTQPRQVILMAGAIENNCLAKEYADAAAKVGRISVVASKSDMVLEWAFPPGNLVGEIIMHGHPYDRTALGRSGPARPLPSGVNVQAWQIPNDWKYGHGDYLPKGGIGQSFVLPLVNPPADAPVPVDATDPLNAGWMAAWSAAAAATQFA